MAETPEPPASTPSGRPRPEGPRSSWTAEDWRQILRDDAPPELGELPFRARRRARRAWRSARRTDRVERLRRERRNVPTPLYVPVIALVLAAAVGVAAWLNTGDTTRDGADRSSRSVAPAAPDSAEPATSPEPSPTATRPADPTQLARAFTLAYTKRLPALESSHTEAVRRAAPYASEALVENLTAHRDMDWNRLVAAQADSAIPTKVTLSSPRGKDRPGPDTSVRLYRDAAVHIQVRGADTYSYTRHLVLEVTRNDVGDAWMVTRVFGLEA